MPSRPKTLLRPVPVPAIQGMQYPVGANPQSALSGLANGPLPLIVFDDDLFQGASAGSNCNFRFNQNRVDAPVANKAFLVAGVTRDSTGAALGNCAVKLYTTADDVERYAAVSDASGNFSFSVPSNGWQMYIVAYLPGSPDRAGTSVNTLLAA